MTEVIGDTRFEHQTRPESLQLGVIAMQKARELTGKVLGKNADDVSIAEVAQEFTKGGFSEWEPDVAQGVRNVLAEEYGIDHL